MAGLSKELKIVFLVNAAIALIYGIMQLFFADVYLTMVEQPTPDVHFTRVSGGTLFVLGLFAIYGGLKKDWEDVKLIFEFAICYLIMLFILDIVYFATFTLSAINFTNTLIATIITAALIAVNIFFYLRERKKE